MKTSIHLISAVAAIFISSYTLAQDQSPIAKSSKSSPTGPEADQGGITIFGDKETPVGLFLAPWKDASSAAGLDRPARLLEETALPIDRATFHRQFDYYNSISDYRNLVKATSAAQ